jgi:hypothetical protein
MKLQLNSLASLERLIGGDTEVELDIRNNIVQAFAGKYLKDIANTNVFKTSLANAQNAILALVKEEYTKAIESSGIASIQRGEYWNSPRAIVLSNDIKVKIECTVRDHLDDVIAKEVEQAMKKFNSDYIEHKINTYITDVVNTRIRDSARIRDGVRAKMEAVLKSA